MNNKIVGWDIGGAHVKAALIDLDKQIIQVIQRPCPLWQGLSHLQLAVAEIVQQWGDLSGPQIMTMTGELVDLFNDREEGVNQLIATMSQIHLGQPLWVYAGDISFLQPADVLPRHIDHIASANWRASARYSAEQQDSGFFVDIGSTTTDILLFNKGLIQGQAVTDFQRLCSRELIYTGIVRTPLMAITQTIDFKGQSVGVMAEHFATMADVYRIAGVLDESHDQLPAADGGDKTVSHSLRRLARMIGCDVNDYAISDWQALAEQFKSQQILRIQRAVEKQCLDEPDGVRKCLVGAGIGRFLVREIAEQMAFEYLDFNDLFADQKQKESGISLADCAPAVAVAKLWQQYNYCVN